MYLSRLHKGICKSVSLGPKNQKMEDKNGIRHVWEFKSTPKETKYPNDDRI
jgi:hypothetical protein